MAVVFAGEGEWDPLAPAEGALDALVAIGAVSDSEAADWRTRLREAMGGVSEAAVDHDVRDRAHAYVGELLARIPPGRSAGLEASTEFQDVLNALHHVGVFSEREMSRWFDQLDERLGRPEARDGDDVERDARLGQLRQVIVGPPERRAGVRVVGFEVYDDAVLLRWHLVRLAADAEGHVPPLPDEVEGGAAARRAREPSFTLHDDRDTAYRMHSGGAGSAGSSSGSLVWSGHAIFTPSIPADVRRLWAVTEAFRFEVVV